MDERVYMLAISVGHPFTRGSSTNVVLAHDRTRGMHCVGVVGSSEEEVWLWNVGREWREVIFPSPSGDKWR